MQILPVRLIWGLTAGALASDGFPGFGAADCFTNSVGGEDAPHHAIAIGSGGTLLLPTSFLPSPPPTNNCHHK